MPSLGPTGPSSAANNTGVGTLAWPSPGNITTDDGNTSQIVKTTTGTETTNWLVASNFGFAVPTGATVDGVIVEWDKVVAIFGSGDCVDSSVRLWDSGVIGSNKALGGTWPISPTFVSYGGAADLWGASLTPAIVNGSGFGAALSASLSRTSSFVIAGVDYVRITVYYTDAAASGGLVPRRRSSTRTLRCM